MTAYGQALKERTRERVPLDWAATQNNLGTALWALGEHQQDLAVLQAAQGHLQAALAVYEEAGAEYYVQMSRDNLQKLRKLIDGFDA